MKPIRILIDGYSLIHAWEGLAPGRVPYGMAARDTLISRITHYRDVTGIPVTIVFDGAGASVGWEIPRSSRDLEIVYSKSGQTADDVIERVAHRMVAFGTPLVVSNDNGVRETVLASGAEACRCEAFLEMMRGALSEFEEDLARWRRQGRTPINRPGI